MKAIIPLAGKGSRLRPHTFATPKPLLRVGGRPVMSYILDDLRRLGVDEIVFVVGYLRDVVRDYIEHEYPDITAHYVVQEVQDGTAGALRLAAPYVDEDVLILFVDTLSDADLTLVQRLPEEWAGVIWAKDVEDYQRFGVILTDDSGAMTRIVEKPTEPISRLANIGLYYIRDHKLLLDGIENTMNSSPGPSGEYYLTDAFQYMVDNGARIRTAPVAGWYDCGKLETLLDTNRHMLETTRGGVDPDAVLENTTLVDPVRIEEGVVVRDSSIGPNVTLEKCVVVEGSTLADVIVGNGASIESSSLSDSMVGSRARISNFSGSLSVAADSEVVG
jgi:glucose-1-phosphate thymidylyltransferase